LFEWFAQAVPRFSGAPYDFELRAIELAAGLATPVLAPQLLWIAGDRGRSEWVRTAALRGLQRLRVSVPAEALCRMLEDAVAQWWGDSEEVFHLLVLADSLDDTMLAVLDGCRPRRRYALLCWCEEADATGKRPTRAVYDVLWRRWAHGVGLGRAADGASDARIPIRYRRNLDGAPAALRDQLGLARLLSLVRDEIKAQSLFDRCRLLERERNEYAAACDVLRELPEARGELARLLGRVALSPRVHADLLEIALGVDRAATLAHVARLPAMWRRIASVVARSPRPEDRAFAEAAARSEDPATAYWAVAAIDQLGEPLGPLPIAELPRIRALAARARRGDRRAVAGLVDASSSPEMVIRAEAVRWLGRLDDARDHVAIFERCLADPDTCDRITSDHHAPVAEQAAVALHRIGGSRTPLLHAYFSAPSGTSGVIRGLLCDDGDTADRVLAWLPFPRSVTELD
jgi:hypothetical protein